MRPSSAIVRRRTPTPSTHRDRSTPVEGANPADSPRWTHLGAASARAQERPKGGPGESGESGVGENDEDLVKKGVFLDLEVPNLEWWAGAATAR